MELRRISLKNEVNENWEEVVSTSWDPLGSLNYLEDDLAATGHATQLIYRSLLSVHLDQFWVKREII